MKQKEVSFLDFNAIDWDMVNQKKAAFIHNEILQYNKELIDHMNIITSKVLGLFSLFLPLLVALAVFLIFNLSTLPQAMRITGIAAAVYLFILLLLLLYVLLPKAIVPLNGSPRAYFSQDFYKRDMRAILIGNITSMYTSIEKNKKIIHKRGKTCIIALYASACFPSLSSTFQAAYTPYKPYTLSPVHL